MKNIEKKNQIEASYHEIIRAGLSQIKNGSITIVKQSNTVVQINLVEKQKLV